MTQKRNRILLLILAVLALVVTVTYLFYGVDFWHASAFYIQYILTSRYERLLAILLTAICIGVSTVVFQTVTHNRILTPSIIGLDSIYVFIQTAMLYFLGAKTTLQMNTWVNFTISLLVMMLFSIVLFRLIFKQQRYSVYFILLCGVILNTLFDSLSSFFQMVMDPDDFLLLQNSLFASFNAINTNLLGLSAIVVFILFLLVWPYLRLLDVIALGRDMAINLGVNYDRANMVLLLFVSLLTAVSTALVGPITFFGLLVVSLTYQMMATYRHWSLMLATILLGIIVLVGGQLIVQKILPLNTTLSVVVNFVGGLYFIVMLLNESRKV